MSPKSDHFIGQWAPLPSYPSFTGNSRCSLAIVALRPVLRVNGSTGPARDRDVGMPDGGIGGAGGGSGVAARDDVIWSTKSRDMMTSPYSSFTIAPVQAHRCMIGCTLYMYILRKAYIR